MKRKIMNFSLLGNDSSRCYRALEDTEASLGTSVSDNLSEEQKEIDNSDINSDEEPIIKEEDPIIKPFDADAFRGKKRKSKKQAEEETVETQSNETSETSLNSEKSKEEENNSKVVDYKYNPIWDVLKKNLSDEENKWDFPEEIKTGKKKDGTALTAEEEFELIKDTVIDNTDFTNGDTFLEEYLESKEKGLSTDDFLKTKVKSFVDHSSMTSRDKAVQSYKDYRDDNAKSLKDKDGNWIDGWSDDDIEVEVDDLRPIQLKKISDEYDSNITVREQKKIKQDIDNYNTKTEKTYQVLEKENEQLVGKYLKNIEGKNTIAGIEFSEAEMAQYRRELPTFMKRELKVDEKTGLKYYISPAEELLRDVLSKTEDTFELLPYLFMVKNKNLKGYTTKIKERVKENLEKTLDDNLDINKGTARVGGFNAKRFREGKF
jgi:hypothetical protein